MNRTKVLIIGSGPAGLTAAIYAARAELAPIVIAGREPGGQLMQTTEVENFPGYDSIQGPELMAKMIAHAQKFGATLVNKDVTAVDFRQRPFVVSVGEDDYRADSVIVATGASAKWLGLPSEERLRGHGVSSCATCDGFFFKGKEIAVVGGGDTALEEATFLTRFASKVTIIHRRDELRASKPLQKRAMNNPKIQFLWNSKVTEVLGESVVTGVQVQDTVTGESSQLSVAGLFVAIGHVPNSEVFRGQITLDDQGYIIRQNGKTYTNVEGVFFAGDVEDHHYRQAITAAGSGCMAAIDAERWLTQQDD